MKSSCLLHKHTHARPHRAPPTASPLTSLWPQGPHYPHCTSSAWTIAGSNVTPTVEPHQRHPNCYDAHSHSHMRTHETPKMSTSAGPCGFTWLQSPTTPVRVNQKGTHSEDKRYEQRSDRDPLIMSSDRCVPRAWEHEPQTREKSRKLYHIFYLFLCFLLKLKLNNQFNLNKKEYF